MSKSVFVLGLLALLATASVQVEAVDCDAAPAKCENECAACLPCVDQANWGLALCTSNLCGSCFVDCSPYAGCLDESDSVETTVVETVVETVTVTVDCDTAPSSCSNECLECLPCVDEANWGLPLCSSELCNTCDSVCSPYVGCGENSFCDQVPPQCTSDECLDCVPCTIAGTSNPDATTFSGVSCMDQSYCTDCVDICGQYVSCLESTTTGDATGATATGATATGATATGATATGESDAATQDDDCANIPNDCYSQTCTNCMPCLESQDAFTYDGVQCLNALETCLPCLNGCATYASCFGDDSTITGATEPTVTGESWPGDATMTLEGPTATASESVDPCPETPLSVRAPTFHIKIVGENLCLDGSNYYLAFRECSPTSPAQEFTMLVSGMIIQPTYGKCIGAGPGGPREWRSLRRQLCRGSEEQQWYIHDGSLSPMDDHRCVVKAKNDLAKLYTCGQKSNQVAVELDWLNTGIFEG